MPDKKDLVKYPDMDGSEHHHTLKNQPGEKGDPNHDDADGALSGDAKKAVKSSDADTQIADALRDIAKDE